MSVLSTSYLVCIRSNFVHSSAGPVTFHEAMGPCASPQGGQRTSLSWIREWLVATDAESPAPANMCPIKICSFCNSGCAHNKAPHRMAVWRILGHVITQL